MVKLNQHRCNKCHKLLPRTSEYFAKNKTRRNGLDYTCKKCSSERGKLWSKNNRDRNNKNRQKRIAKRKKLNVCIKCGNKKLINAQYCEEHWFRISAKNNLGSEKRWEELRALAISQKYRCVYTNINLTPGLNMSLDHKIPVTRNSALAHEISNVQWVSYSINVFKNYMTHEEFLMTCKTIYEEFKLDKVTLIDKNDNILDIVPHRRVA